VIPSTIYDQLKKVRASKTLELSPTPLLRKEIEGLDGTIQPFRLRYYQGQGIYHLLVVPRMVLGDGTGLGKTVEAIGALCYLWAKDPSFKVLVVCPKSAIRQWAGEIRRFTNGVKAIIGTGSIKEREKAYREWVDSDQPSVLITNYHLLVRDWDAGAGKEPGLLDKLTASKKLVTIFDECTAFKNPATKTHQTCKFVSARSVRVYGLTATLLKNNLIEGFGIYKVIVPDLFSTKTDFLRRFCITELRRVPGGAKIPIIVGYQNLQEFRTTIDPHFYGRPKHMVSEELPNLTTREVICELSRAEEEKYKEALSGVLEHGDGEIRDYQETKDLTSLIYAQEVVDSLALIGIEDDTGAKERALLDLLSEEFDGEKVVIYTQFETLVTRLQKLLAKEKIKSVRITGKESDAAREKAKATFQNTSSGVDVIFITNAGSEAINLQMAVAMIFVDTPWVWGDYVQLLGRMIRIGSPHPSVLAIHLISMRPNREPKRQETIDHKKVKALRKKKGVIDQVIGEAAVGALRFERSVDTVREIIDAMKEDAV
jgi:SNF2 family DNA or RNA helicase